jgi:phosphatidylglycerophosphate synthase
VHHGLLRSSLACILPAGLTVGVIAQLCTLHLALEPAYVPKTVAVFAAGAALVLIGLPRHHPFAVFGAANQVTVARGVLVALLAGLIGERTDTGAPLLAMTMATIVAVLDGVDGWLARRSRMTSAFGARFDMETDAALILVLAVLAWLFGKAGLWVVACGVLRYAFVGAGMLLPWLRAALPPSGRRRAIAVVQMVALIIALAPVVPVALSAPVAAIGLAALSLSFLLDIAWLFQNASQVRASVSPQ